GRGPSAARHPPLVRWIGLPMRVTGPTFQAFLPAAAHGTEHKLRLPSGAREDQPHGSCARQRPEQALHLAPSELIFAPVSGIQLNAFLRSPTDALGGGATDRHAIGDGLEALCPPGQ